MRNSIAQSRRRQKQNRFRRLVVEPLESRALLAQLINAGTASDVLLDLPPAASVVVVEDDGIAGNGILQLRSTNGTFVAIGPLFLDVTGNGVVTASDVLAVINHLNAFGTAPDTPPESEPHAAPPAGASPAPQEDADWLALVAADVAANGKRKRG